MQTNNIFITVEQAVLSSIFFSQEIESISTILEPKDFYVHAHQKIYAAMLELSKKDLPIDETFILKHSKDIAEEDLIAILSVNAITNPIAYAKELKEAARKRELDTIVKTFRAKADDSDKSSIELLNELKLSIANLENNQSIDSLLKIKDFNLIEESEPKFFLESILPIQEHEINIISAKGGSGKSYASAYLMLELANKHNLKCFGWFSEDGAGITKKRINSLSKLHELQIKNITIAGKENRAFQFVSTTNRKLEIDSKFYLFKKQLKIYDVILLDPLIAFFGGDENSNADARYFMNLLNEWCEQENKTIILIHHHSKGEGGTARGAGAFIDACRIHYTIDYKYTDKEKKNIDNSCRIAKIEKTNHFSGKREYEILLFEQKLKNNFVHQYGSKREDPIFDLLDEENNDTIIDIPDDF